MKNMKKLILLFAVALLAVSCQPERTEMRSYNMVASAGQWQPVVESTGGVYYACSFSLPDLTRGVFNNGAVLAYIVDGNRQEPITQARLKTDGTLDWTNTVEFDYGVGVVNFYYTNSDFEYFASEPGRMEFRVVLIATR